MHPIRMCFVVIWSLAVLIDCTCGITIFGRISVIKNDCYERMAIGEKLSPKQTYKTFDHNTVLKCETECTQEKETCRTFSFGIGPKGNATCLLGKNPVRETADLKPIGTISDTDYDLFIKKLDCQIVHEPPILGPHGSGEKPQHFGSKPLNSENIHHAQTGYAEQGPPYRPEENHGDNGNLPAQASYFNSVSRPNEGHENGYQYDKPNNPFPPQQSPPNGPIESNLQHVQTLVSIASGPQSVLHPVHDILVSGESYEQGKPTVGHGGGAYGNQDANMSPFRPPALHNPYEVSSPQQPPQRPLYDDYDRPDRPYSDYGSLKPNMPRPGYEQGDDYLINNRPSPPRPSDFVNTYRPDGFDSNNDRPDPEYGLRPSQVSDTGYDSGGQLTIDRRKYESSNQFNSFESESFSYGSEKPPRYPSNYNFYDRYNKPNSNHQNRYGSVIPHPNEYTRPDLHYDYLFVRPNSEPYDDRKPLRPEYGYKPVDVGGQGYQGYDGADGHEGSRYKPNFVDANNDGKRPSSAGNGIKQEYDIKPPRPTSSDTNRNDRHPTRYDQTNPSKPHKVPADSTSTSRPPSTELSNHYGGVDYTNKQYGKPGEFLNVKGDQGNRKIVTQNVGIRGEQITSIITELENAGRRPRPRAPSKRRRHLLKTKE